MRLKNSLKKVNGINEIQTVHIQIYHSILFWNFILPAEQMCMLAKYVYFHLRYLDLIFILNIEMKRLDLAFQFRFNIYWT